MRRIIRGAFLIDPGDGFQGVADLYIADGRIIGRGTPPDGFQAEEVMEAHGLTLCPGLVDLSVQAREPGNGQDGDMATELGLALAGGVVHCVLPPDTEPVADSAGVIHQQHARARALGLAKVYPLGALTAGLAGTAPAEMGELLAAGAAALGQGDSPVADSALLRLALEYAADLGCPVFLHSEDGRLAGDGVMHEGALSARLGLPGRPGAAEWIGVQRDLAVAELAGCPVHLRHLSTTAAVDALRTALGRRQRVTADCAIHHLLLTDKDVGYFNVHAKTLPPLRPVRDRDALRQAVGKGVISAIASDHRPWRPDYSRETFIQAPFGISAVSLLLPLTLCLVDEGVLDLPAAIHRLTLGPAQVLGITAGTLQPGAPADLCLFDADAPFVVDPSRLPPAGRNMPYGGWELRGRVRYAFVDGVLRYRG